MTSSQPRWTRRELLRRTAGASAGLAAGAALWTPDLWTPARARALRQALAGAVAPDGTTLASTIVLGTGDGFVTLSDGPGWPTLPRTELADLDPGRVDRRTALAAIVQLTDVHIVDAQSPGRVEFTDEFGDPYTAAFRPQETLTTQVQTSMVERINTVARGPVTGRPLDCAVSTGDNIDNQQTNELEWFMAVLNGGTITPNSGATDRYEGVQAADWASPDVWHPDEGPDNGVYEAAGFPRVPGLLDAAIASFTSPGLSIPWYSCYGNHDGLIQGNLPASDAIDAVLTGDRKITALPAGMTDPVPFVVTIAGRPDEIVSGMRDGTYPTRGVTPDDRRRTVRTEAWVQAHLDRPGRAGAPGHGYDDGHLEAPALWYSFPIAPGVLGISLDTGGYNSGSIGQLQIDWLETELARAHSRAFDEAGGEVTTGGTDQLVVLFSHFTIGTMTGAIPDPARPDERRYEGPELVAFLQRWPNIVAWVNGHTHTNTVTPVPDPSGRTNGFWEITTASHVDFPEQARIVEVVDNGDGTLSLICTMLEHAAPAAVDPDDRSPLGLAGLSRLLGANDLGVDPTARLGRVEDLNVELGLRAPFDLRAAGLTTAADANAPTPGTPGATDASGGAPLAVAGAAVVAVGAAAAGALALRRRVVNQPVDNSDDPS